jgi:hypothetical protein
MSDTAHRSLFPLPLTAFERYMLIDDRPDYPMVFFMEFDFSGEVDRRAFESALEEALVRNPLLCAHVEHGRRGPRFVHAGEQRPPVDWDREGAPVRLANGEPIDLTREVGLRLWVRQSEGRATLTVQFHHACCDGIGAARFLGDLFAAYGIRTAVDGHGPQHMPVDYDSLQARGQFQIEPPEPVSLARVVWSTVSEAVKWAARRPTPLAIPPGSDVATNRDAPYRNVEFHQFDEHESRALRQLAKGKGVTVNDLLLRDLFQTMRDWNEEYLPGKAGKWLQINMPQNLRQRGSEQMSAANKLGYAFLARRTRELDDAQALLDGIRWETGAVKQWSLGLFFISGLTWTLRIPGLCRWFVRSNRCFATALLSNLGEFDRWVSGVFPYDAGRLVLGNLRLETCRFVPPVRHLTHAAFVVATYAHRLGISLRCDPHRFPSGGVHDLLARYVQRIGQTVAEGTAV